MILTCPECSTRYLTDPVALGQTGRTVRCAKCGHSWHQMPPVDAGPRAEVLSPSLEPPLSQTYVPPPGGGLPARIEPRAPRRRGGAWALAAVLVLVILGGLYLGRAHIVAAWPGAAPVYASVGLPVEMAPAGLSFADVTLTRQSINGRDTVVVEGRILNNGSAALPVPPLLASVRDADDRIVETWTERLEIDELAAGAALDFRTSRTDLPEAAQRLAVGFAADS
jgi:predicted Zn finger-like uncharacterized protein